MKFLKQLFISVIAFILVTGLCELFIRNAKISELSFAEFYPDIGKGLAKPRTFFFLNEGFGIVSTNPSRYIGENVSLNKSENTIRVALLGDSYIESIQVFERHYFGNITRQNLSEKFKNRHFEILNFGRQNFNLGNMYAYQRLLVDKFDVDYVLYFLSADDLACDYSNQSLLPITTIEQGHLEISLDLNEKDLHTYQKTKFLTQNFAIANILNACRRKVNNSETLPVILDKFYPEKDKRDGEIQDEVNTIFKLDPVTVKIISEMDPNTIIINRADKSLPEDFEELIAENNLHYWDLKDTYRDLKKDGIIYNEWRVTNQTGHWNPYGHMAIGKSIANNLSLIIEGENNEPAQYIRNELAQ